MRSRIPVLLIVAALAAGCGSGEEEPDAAPASQLTTSAPSLAGSYERRLTKADVERTDGMRDEAGPNQEKPDPGPLELTLDDGTLAMTDVRRGLHRPAGLLGDLGRRAAHRRLPGSRPGCVLRAGHLADRRRTRGRSRARC